MNKEIEDNRQARKDKLFRILEHIMDKESKGELISLWEIYEDHGCPKYKTPKRVFSYPRQKEFIQYIIEKNDMRMDKVIKYDGKDILVEFELATHYLSEMDAYYLSLMLDLTLSIEPNEFQRMCFQKWRSYGTEIETSLEDSIVKHQNSHKEAISRIIDNNWYLYMLEIDYESKELIICVTDKLQWNLIPTNPEHFEIILNDFPGYTLIEIDEKLAKYHGDRNRLLGNN